MREIPFVKGHGTLNDFVLLTDPDDRLRLSDAEVALLCDRRAGVGADGILRAVRAGHVASWTGDAGIWFMDYRNADGSVAEMCGNGLRVFVRHLLELGLASGPVVPVGTRAGLRTGEPLADGRVRVTMGAVTLGHEVTIRGRGAEYAGVSVDVGNPHAVCVLPPGVAVEDVDLAHAPSWSPSDAFPDGVNVEFVQVVGPDHLRMRVHERGVGETRSCGTGVVAAAAAASTGYDAGRTVLIQVPGGDLEVSRAGDEALLTGPAVLVARGVVDLGER